MGYAFISYNSEQLSSANRLKDLLNANGIRTWMAPGDIPPGQKYSAALNMAIRNCSCLVLLLTSDSMNSEHVERELDIALRNKKTIIPVQLDDVILNESFEYYLSVTQIIKIQKIDVRLPEFKQLLSVVSSCVGAVPDANPPETPKPAASVPESVSKSSYEYANTYKVPGMTMEYSVPSYPYFHNPYVASLDDTIPDLSVDNHGVPAFMKKKKTSANAGNAAGEQVRTDPLLTSPPGIVHRQYNGDNRDRITTSMSSGNGVPAFLKRKEDDEDNRITTSLPSDYEAPDFLKVKNDKTAASKTAKAQSHPYERYHVSEELFETDPVPRNYSDLASRLDRLSDEITNKEFSYESRGYSRDEVDNYLDSVCEQLDRPDLTCKMLDAYTDEIAEKMFSIESRGYSRDEVDNYLDEVIEKLEALVSEAKKRITKDS